MQAGGGVVAELEASADEQETVNFFLQGMNDIGNGASTSRKITAAMQQIIDRVHARGLAIIGGTLFPWPDQIWRDGPVRWRSSGWR